MKNIEIRNFKIFKVLGVKTKMWTERYSISTKSSYYCAFLKPHVALLFPLPGIRDLVASNKQQRISE